jgi:hypothetical protein
MVTRKRHYVTTHRNGHLVEVPACLNDLRVSVSPLRRFRGWVTKKPAVKSTCSVFSFFSRSTEHSQVLQIIQWNWCILNLKMPTDSPRPLSWCIQSCFYKDVIHKHGTFVPFLGPMELAVEGPQEAPDMTSGDIVDPDVGRSSFRHNQTTCKLNKGREGVLTTKFNESFVWTIVISSFEMGIYQ